MEIADYELFELPPRWLFLRIETKEGLVGWGEPIVEGQWKAVKAAVEKFMTEYLIGSDPLRTEYHWQQMYRGSFHRGGPVLMSAIAGIDQALWDLKGKHFETPVYRLLGGPVRDKVRVYHWISGDQNVDLGAEATRSVESGFQAIKLNATGKLKDVDTPNRISQAINRLKPVFDAVPDDVDVILDFHGRASRAMAPRLLEAIEPSQPLFVDEPLLPEQNSTLSKLSATGIPLATGKRLYSRWEFQDIVQSDTIDIVQPGVSHAGGITEVKKIAEQAETNGLSVAPVASVGPIAFAASLQLDAALHNFSIQEQIMSFDAGMTPYGRIVSNTDDFALSNGYISLPEDPGLGLQIEEDEVRELASGDATEWSMITWKHNDGSLAEW